MVTLPVIGSFLEAAGMIIEKKILGKRNINFKNYTVYEFLAILVVMLPIIYFFWRIDKEAFIFGKLAVFILVVIFSVMANLLIFYSLKREHITEFEPVWLMQPFFTIILAFIFYESERNFFGLGLALTASITLVASHVKKHHFTFDRYILAAFLGSFCFSVELVLSRLILDYYSPFSLYFLRSSFIFLITFIIFRPSFKPVIREKKIGAMILFVGLIWVFYRVIIYYGYLAFGIIFTTTIFILSPVFIFLFATFYLKEKPTLRYIISTLIMVICVVLAILLR
ncbi:DMT family transporter [Candidatus Pacearchaeota archaeon]|nr:DMT family transporter [Candidatus Pacearchaeota archaeon]